MRELVDDGEHPVFPSIMGAGLDNVAGPDLVGRLGAQADARSISKPEAALLRLPGGNLQHFASPDPLDPLVVGASARPAAQQLGDPAVAVAAILAHQRNHVGGEFGLVVAAERNPALGRAMFSEHPADPTLRDLQLIRS